MEREMKILDLPLKKIDNHILNRIRKISRIINNGK